MDIILKISWCLVNLIKSNFSFKLKIITFSFVNMGSVADESQIEEIINSDINGSSLVQFLALTS